MRQTLINNFFNKVEKHSAFLARLIQGYRQTVSKPSISSQRGQGLIEYLLLLVLTVALVMALSRGVGRPIQNYIQNNVLNVVGCMLRVGQFPTRSFGLCVEAVNLNFDYGGSIPGSAGASSSNSSEDEASENNRESNNPGNRSSSTNRSRTNFRSSTSTGSVDGGSSGGGGEEDAPKVVKIQTEDTGSNSIRTNSSSNEPTTITRRIRIDGQIGGSFSIAKDKEKEAEKKANLAVTAPKAAPRDEIERLPTNTSFKIKKPEPEGPKGPELNLIDTSFSFTNIIKWVLIIGILVIFGFFALSQINSIRKGMD